MSSGENMNNLMKYLAQIISTPLILNYSSPYSNQKLIDSIQILENKLRNIC